MNSQTHDFSLDTELGYIDDPTHEEPAASAWLDRFSLVAKLRGAVVSNMLILVVVTSIVIVAAFFAASTGRTLSDWATIEMRVSHAAMHMGDVDRDLSNSTDQNRSAVIDSSLEKLTEAEAFLFDTRSSIENNLSAENGAALDRFVDMVKASHADLETVKETGDYQDITAVQQDIASSRSEMVEFARQMRGDVASLAIELFHYIENLVIFGVGLVILTIVLSFLGAGVIIRNIAGMISKITDTMEQLAAGDTQIQIPGRDRQDEIGAMARGLAVFRAAAIKLSENSEREIERSKTLQVEKSKMLEDLAHGLEVSVGEVINAVGKASSQLKSTSEEMVKLADDSSKQSEDASSSMKETSRNVTAAAAATDEFALSIGEISRQASASANLARESSELVSTANGKMTDLSGAADEIGKIVELIQSIAQRTNLLALNASIEAARGGEAGRGFAVVAAEVKELATQTSNATTNVANTIRAMQDSTASSAEDLTTIVTQIAKLEQTAIAIAAAVDQQRTSGQDLAENIDTVAHGTTEVYSQLEHLRDASVATGSASGQVLTAANELDSYADKLRNTAKQYLEDVRGNAAELSSV